MGDDGVAGYGPGRCCSPRHRLPFESIMRVKNGFKTRMDDVASTVCRALELGGLPGAADAEHASNQKHVRVLCRPVGRGSHSPTF